MPGDRRWVGNGGWACGENWIGARADSSGMWIFLANWALVGGVGTPEFVIAAWTEGGTADVGGGIDSCGIEGVDKECGIIMDGALIVS